MERARGLEPRSPIMYQDSVEILCCAHRYDEALEVARQARELTPTSKAEYPWLPSIYYYKGDYQKYLELEEEKADRAGRSVAALKSLADKYLGLNREKDGEESSAKSEIWAENWILRTLKLSPKRKKQANELTKPGRENSWRKILICTVRE